MLREKRGDLITKLDGIFPRRSNRTKRADAPMLATQIRCNLDFAGRKERPDEKAQAAKTHIGSVALPDFAARSLFSYAFGKAFCVIQSE
ncbi:MAG: hypothetical protein D6743_20025 [Calditrichaeota bacterium]|nr:MAG: hypothetical protein D6743_20025 [Calditrichota bacterium]